jgi:hypothetical protein
MLSADECREQAATFVKLASQAHDPNLSEHGRIGRLLNGWSGD